MTNKQLATLMRFQLALFMAGVDPRDSKKMEVAAAANKIIEDVDDEAGAEEDEQPPAGEWRLIDLQGNALAVENGALIFVAPEKWSEEYPLFWDDELAAKRYSHDKNVWGLVKPVFFPRDVTKA